MVRINNTETAVGHSTGLRDAKLAADALNRNALLGPLQGADERGSSELAPAHEELRAWTS